MPGPTPVTGCATNIRAATATNDCRSASVPPVANRSKMRGPMTIATSTTPTQANGEDPARGPSPEDGQGRLAGVPSHEDEGADCGDGDRNGNPGRSRAGDHDDDPDQQSEPHNRCLVPASREPDAGDADDQAQHREDGDGAGIAVGQPLVQGPKRRERGRSDEAPPRHPVREHGDQVRGTHGDREHDGHGRHAVAQRRVGEDLSQEQVEAGEDRRVGQVVEGDARATGRHGPDRQGEQGHGERGPQGRRGPPSGVPPRDDGPDAEDDRRSGRR